jgi:hypothetical protein
MLGSSCPGRTLAEVAGEQLWFGCCLLSPGLHSLLRLVSTPGVGDLHRQAYPACRPLTQEPAKSEEVADACPSCLSSNQAEFLSEINIHFPGPRKLD